MAARDGVSPTGWDAPRGDSRQSGSGLRVQPRSATGEPGADAASGAFESRVRAAMQELQQELEQERAARLEAELVLADTTQARACAALARSAAGTSVPLRFARHATRLRCCMRTAPPRAPNAAAKLLRCARHAACALDATAASFAAPC